MAKSLETRIERLEAASPQGMEARVVIICPVPACCENGHKIPLGELLGIGSVRRKAGESEEELKNRAYAQAARDDSMRGAILLEDREKVGCPVCSPTS